MAMKVKWFLVLLFGARVLANEFNYLHRSAKGLMMGDAYTTLATGPATLFYNPALAVRNNLFSFYPVPVDAKIIDIIKEKEKLDRIDSENISSFADSIIGYPIHIGLAATPTLKFGWFTLTPFAIAKANIIARDRIHPVLSMDYRYDRGVCLGFGFIPFGNGRKGRSVALGFSVKHIKRQGIMGDYDVFGTTVADIISTGSTDINDIKRILGQAEGKGTGFDVGIDWRHKFPNATFAMGLSALDVADTKIKVYQGEGDLPDQQMSLNFGTSFSQKFGSLLDWTISLDIHPIRANIEFKEKIHGGLRIGIPLLDFFVGSNGGLLSYGVSFGIPILEISAGVYESRVDYMTSRRLAAYVSVLDFAF